VADGYVKLINADTLRDTWVYIDTDGRGSADPWGTHAFTLEGVYKPGSERISGLSWADLTGDAGPGQGSTIAFSSGNQVATEGTGETRILSWSVTRSGDLSDTASVNWTAAGAGNHHADGADFTGGVMPSGVLNFAPGEATKTITVQIAGDSLHEPEETFTITLAGATGATVSDSTIGRVVWGTIRDDDPPTSGGDGDVINSPGPGSTLTGTDGNDTLNASRGADVLTGGAGADAFAWADVPWSAARVTDFVLGTDRLDLSGALGDVGYSGSDPVADGYVKLINSSGASTYVYLDSDGPGPADQWGSHIITLEGVRGGGEIYGTSSLTWAQLSAGSAPPAPGQRIVSDQYPDTLQGGAGADTLVAGQGPDQLTGGGGADVFVFEHLPWNAGHVTEFEPGVDKLDLRALHQAHPDGALTFLSDGTGGTRVFFDVDDPEGGEWPFLLTTLDGVAPGQVGSGDWLW
jgi:Ca2+-binding RTX toxin-like protein